MADAAVAPYPLQWPRARPRRGERRSAKFRSRRTPSGMMAGMTVATSIARLQYELAALGASYVVISSNLEPRLDGRPRSGQAEPSDPGVAVYFQLGGRPHCLPCDTYTRVADNIAAVAAHIAATRAVERHGVASVTEMFSGFLALPAPLGGRSWRHVLGLHAETNISREAVEAAYRRLARERHPDRGGQDWEMAELNTARDAARAELGNG